MAYNSSTFNIAFQNQTEAEIIVYKNPIVGVLANELETRVNKSGAILEITSKLQEVKYMLLLLVQLLPN